MPRSVVNPSDVVITNCQLIHKEGTLDVLPIVSQIDVYETLKRPCMRGFVDLVDGTGILASVDLSGSDFELEFYSIDENQPTTLKFKIDKVSNASAQGRSKNYTLDLITPEYFKAISTQVTENFFDMKPEEMISLILNQYVKTEKSFIYESTGSVDTVPITSLNPLQAIDKIRKRTVSGRSKSSSFVFFESQTGFKFITIEELYNRGKEDVGDRVFSASPISKVDERNSDWRNILGYTQVRAQNLAETIALGGVKNKVWAFNLETGEYNPYVFDKSADEYNQNEYHLRRDLVNEYNPVDSSEQAKNTFVVIRNEGDLQRAEKSGKLAGFLPKMLSNMINIHVHGDNLLTAGEVVDVTIARIDGLTTYREDEMLSGKYILGSVRHIIQRTEGASRYTCACELIKPGFVES